MIKSLQRLFLAFHKRINHLTQGDPVLAQDIRTKLHTGAAYEFHLANRYATNYRDPLPTAVIVPGWGSRVFSSTTYAKIGGALREIGYHTLLLSLRGNEESAGNLNTVTR